MPAALAERPELPVHLAFTWTAFMDLSGDRQIGFGAVGAIPFTAIDRYGIRFGVEGDEFERFLGLIRAMDAEWRAMNAKKPDTDA